jgi:hypothetical protein
MSTHQNQSEYSDRPIFLFRDTVSETPANLIIQQPSIGSTSHIQKQLSWSLPVPRGRVCRGVIKNAYVISLLLNLWPVGKS